MMRSHREAQCGLLNKQKKWLKLCSLPVALLVSGNDTDGWGIFTGIEPQFGC